ncbi:type IV secretory system conjugative DNA transfer family protein [Streptomyces cavernae]|uniref:type IV secretory system conjugative DNA transfer family protein n=1 Tax=Streptomyces cavernae TaxID=2259034 RepID=UPI000FEC0CB2|nr:type IV secretory system conjugative DNA transfer family protein [Streptomyces cavernae]
MRPDDHLRGDGRERGIPDGLLIGVLAFLLGMTLLVWSATGLAGLFAKGAWPTAVTFGRTPLAMRHLIAQPHDITGAWPETPGAELSGYGLFWGLFIGQLMMLLVLTVFVMGVVARWRAGRRGRRMARLAPAPHEVPTEEHAHKPVRDDARDAARDDVRNDVRNDVRDAVREPAREPAREPVATTPVAQAPPAPAPASASARMEHEPSQLPAEHEPSPPPGSPPPGSPLSTPSGPLVLGPAETRRPRAVQAVLDAVGPALVITSSPAVWSETKDARAKLGPVLLYDPSHLCDTPARLHWSPTTGCEDKPTAAARAAAVLAPIRPAAKIDAAVADTAETLLRSYLHAAAVDGRTIRHVHRWAQGNHIQEAVRALRTHPKAASGAAGELEAALTSHPERRDIAQELTARALSALSTVNVRESCTPNRADTLALDSFVHEGGTLYVVGESIEDPKTSPGAMPLLTALAASVVERGRRMAERSSSGRLDPPLTLVLDDVAAVAPVPQLPDLLTTGPDRGLPVLALLRSREQARSRWPNWTG